MSDKIEQDDGSTSAQGPDRVPVLEVFGIKLQVSNPRLAELLTMDAREALTTDVSSLARERLEAGEVIAQAAPDAVVAVPTPHAQFEDLARQEFRNDVGELGRRMGFETFPDGAWRAPGGVTLLVRAVEREVTLAAASHFVSEVAQHREITGGADATALFVVAEQGMADVFKVAIRQRRLYHVMRTITRDNLRAIVAFLDGGVLEQAHALVLLTPMQDIDAGEVVSVIRAAAGSAESRKSD